MKTRIQKEFAATITRTPSCAVSVVAGGVSSTAIKGRDQDMAVQTGGGTGITSAMSIIVNADQIGALKSGEPITVGESARIVVSQSVDPVGALRKIGVSAPFDYRVSFTGRRNENNTPRQAAQGIYCLKISTDTPPEYGSVPNPEDPRWVLCIRQSDWLDNLKPQTGDVTTDEDGTQFRVMRVEFRVGVWILYCTEVPR